MVASLLKVTTSAGAPLDSASSTSSSTTISDFLTIQSLTNFAAMTGAITAAWNALQRLNTFFSSVWVPFVFAGTWGLISILISLDALKKDNSTKFDGGKVLGRVFVAVVNSLVLTSAVVGFGIAPPSHP